MGIEELKEKATYFRTVFLSLYGLTLVLIVGSVQLYPHDSFWAWAFLCMGIVLLFGVVITIIRYFKAFNKLVKYEDRQNLRKWRREIKNRRR